MPVSGDHVVGRRGNCRCVELVSSDRGASRGLPDSDESFESGFHDAGTPASWALKGVSSAGMVVVF
jgi:hypothetical protein